MEKAPAVSLKREAWTCVWIIVLALSIYLLTLPADLRNNADTVDRFSVTQKLIQDHSLVFSYTNPHDSRIVRGRHGHWYAIYAPGQSLLMIPLYGIGKAVSVITGLDQDFAKALSVRALDCILGAFLLAIFYLLCLAVIYKRRTAVLLTLILAFASTLWPDVQSGQEQTQVGLALVFAVFSALQAARSSRSSGRTRWLMACGIGLGFGLLTRYDFIIYAVPVVLFLIWKLRSELGRRPYSVRQVLQDVAPLMVTAAPFVLVDAAWNTLRFGAPWRVGQSAGAQFGFPLWQGIPNLLISPGKGLLWYLPLLWLLPFVFAPFRRRAADVLWLSMGILIIALVFYGGLIYWHGDPAWGPRYLFPTVPLLLLPLGEVIERFGSLRLSLLTGFVAVAALSLAIQLTAVSADPWRFWYHLIQVRANAGEVFRWKPTQYDYYWSSNASLAPVLYQFASMRGIVATGLGDQSTVMPYPTPAQSAQSAAGCHFTSPKAYDTCQLWGVAKRPLNTIDSIWLNGRYQWIDPLPVPLSIVARVLIIASLSIAAMIGALGVYVFGWRGPDRSPTLSTGRIAAVGHDGVRDYEEGRQS